MITPNERIALLAIKKDLRILKSMCIIQLEHAATSPEVITEIQRVMNGCEEGKDNLDRLLKSKEEITDGPTTC